MEGELEVLVYLWRDVALSELAVLVIMSQNLELFCLNFPKSYLVQLSLELF